MLSSACSADGRHFGECSSLPLGVIRNFYMYSIAVIVKTDQVRFPVKVYFLSSVILLSVLLRMFGIMGMCTCAIDIT